MDRTTRLVVLLMAVLSHSVGLAGVTTVTLRATVRLAPDEALTLGAVADIEGTQRERLAGIALGGDGAALGAWRVIDAEGVRGLIEGSGASYGSVVVRGARASVTRMGAPGERPAGLARGGETGPAPGVVTVREHLESWLRSRYGVGAGDMRVTFEDRDAGVLLTPTEGRVVEVRMIGNSARPALRVTVYERDAIVLSETLRIGVRVRVEAPIALLPLRRGERVSAEGFEVRSVWTDPTDPPAEVSALAGQVLRRAVDPGEVIRFGQLEAPVVVTRGQDVSVRTVRGSVVVTTIARARHDACEGDILELDATDRSGRRFTARVAGPGRAVMIDPTEVMP